MATTHDRLRAMVIKQLGLQPKGKGSVVVFHRRTGGIYDPATGGVTAETVTDYTGSGLRVNYSEYAYKNETIVYGDFQLYLSPVKSDGTEMPLPHIGDQLTFIGKKARVINVAPFNENGVGCGWNLQVRYG